MRNFWSWLGLNTGKHVGIVTLCGLAITVGLGIGIFQVQFKTDNASLLNRTDTAYKDNAAYQQAFGGDDMVAMFTADPGYNVTDLLNPANLSQIKRLTTQLDAVHGVESVVTPLSILQLIDNVVSGPAGNITKSVAGKMQLADITAATTAEAKKLRTNDALSTLKRFDAVPAADRVIGNPGWDNFLLYANNGKIRPGVDQYYVNSTHTVMFVRLVGNLSIEQESETAGAITTVMSGVHFQHFSVITSGTPDFLKALNDYLKTGMLKLGGLAGLLMLAILVLLFDVRWRLLPFGIVALGLVWVFGLIGYLNLPLTLASIAALPIMLGIGIDYAIQMHSRVEEEVMLDRVSHPIQATARNLCPALLVVTLDAVFAFSVLQFSGVPMIRQFGLMLAIGVVVICICSIIGPLALLGIREFKSPTSDRPKRGDFSQGALSRIAVKLGSLPRQAAIPLALVSVAVFLGGLGVEGKLVVQTNAIQWINQQSSTIKNIQMLQKQVSTAGELDVLVSGPNVMTNPSVNYLAKFQDTVVRRDSSVLQPPISLLTVAQDLTVVPGAAPIMPSALNLHDVYLQTPSAMQRILVGDGGRDLDVLFIAKTADLNALQGAVNIINAQHPPEGVSVRPGGIAEVGAGLLQDIEHHRTLLTYLAVLFVLAWLTIRLRSFVRALLSVVPVLIAVGLANLVAFALSIRLSPATAISGPLIVAVCTEFTSLMLLRYLEERSRGLEPRAAFNSTSARTGRAFIVSGLTAVAGVAVMATSSMPILSGFGEVVAFNVFIALMSALVILPPVVVWADQHNWVSRGMPRPDPEAHALVQAAGAVQPA